MKKKKQAEVNQSTEELEEVMDTEAETTVETEVEELDAMQEMEKENAQLQEEIQKLQDQHLRNAAELENFKRRMNEERIRETKYRAQSLVSNIIPAIDNFERALATTVEDEATATFLTGFKMIHAQLLEALAQEGVEAIQSEGVAFDPTVHQAVMQEAVEGMESGMVTAELQKGYKLKDRVIRPAMVKVSE